MAAHGIGKTVDPLDLLTAAEKLGIKRFVKYAERPEAGRLSTTDFVDREKIDELKERPIPEEEERKLPDWIQTAKEWFEDLFEKGERKAVTESESES